MTSYHCQSCGNLIGERQPDGRVYVSHKGREFNIPIGGDIGCTHMVRKSYGTDGKQVWGPCGALTPVVEARTLIPV